MDINRHSIDKDKGNEENIEDVRDFIRGEREARSRECEIDFGKGAARCNVGIPAADYARAQGWVVGVTVTSRVMRLLRSEPWSVPEKVDGRRKKFGSRGRSSKYRTRNVKGRWQSTPKAAREDFDG